jgi:hypothetical protein
LDVDGGRVAQIISLKNFFRAQHRRDYTVPRKYGTAVILELPF